MFRRDSPLRFSSLQFFYGLDMMGGSWCLDTLKKNSGDGQAQHEHMWRTTSWHHDTVPGSCGRFAASPSLSLSLSPTHMHTHNDTTDGWHMRFRSDTHVDTSEAIGGVNLLFARSKTIKSAAGQKWGGKGVLGRRGDKQRNTTQSAEFPHAVKKVHESYKHNLSRRKKIQSTVAWKMLLFFLSLFS